MSEEAAELWSGIKTKYIEAQYPNHKVWNFSPSNDEQRETFRELRARGYIETMGMGEQNWLISDGGLEEILSDVEMTPEAIDVLTGIGELYVKAGHPNHGAWAVSPEKGEEPQFAELQARGFIEIFTARNSRLTQDGLDWILQRS